MITGFRPLDSGAGQWASQAGWTDDGTVVRLQTNTDNVGIGTTTSPGAKLDVAGTVRMTGFQLGSSATAGYVLTTNALGIGIWQPAAGGGDITGVSAGTGLTGGGLSGDVTLSANTIYLQRRVSGTCVSNQAIRVVNNDGTVSCAHLPASAICTWSGTTYSTGAQCHTYGCPISTWTQTWTCTGDGSWIKTRGCWNLAEGSLCGS